MLDFHYCPRAAWCVLLLRIHMLAALIVYYDFRVHAQFEDVTNAYSLYVSSEAGVIESGVSFHDFDRDGLDDLTYGSFFMGVYTFRNTGEGFESVNYFPMVGGRIQHPIWVDFDNDDDADFFATRMGECPVLFRNEGDMTFTDISHVLECSYANPHNTAASWGDYDNDGWLDVYIANYYPQAPGATGWCYHNNGDGSFTELAVELGIDNGITPTYQVLWIDYDQDGDQDLLISNDKFTGNRLYRNDGSSVFTDVSEASGFEVAINAMSLSPGDPDRDGDFDFYISNTTEGNVLMLQDSGVFTDVAVNMGAAVNANCWGSVFVDTQGKMWEDLYVVATGPQQGVNTLLRNLNGSSFQPLTDIFSGEDDEYLCSVAKGDSNGDGRYDIACNPYQNNHSLLFESTLSDSNWVKINLQGTVSNRDGIGAIVRCHVGEVVQLRAKTCGENYLSQDSPYLLFSAQGNAIDSIVIQWPSGIRDVIYNPELFQTIHIIETQPESMVQMIEQTLCPDDTLILQPEGALAVQWFDGSSDFSMMVSAPGEYTAIVTDELGQNHDVIFSVSVAQEIDTQLQIVEPSCYGSADGAIQWGTEDWLSVWVYDVIADGDALMDLSAGDYELTFQDGFGCTEEVTIELPEPEPLSAVYSVVPGCYGDSSAYEIAVSHAQGALLLMGLDTLEGFLPQGEYAFSLVDEMGCTFVDQLNVESLEPFTVQNYTDTICDAEVTAAVQLQFTGGIEPLLHVSDDLPLEALPPGEYQTQWMDAAGCIASGNIAILQFAPLEIEVEMNVGQIELEIEGGVPPFAIDWSNGDTGLVLIAEPGLYECLVTDAVGCTEQAVAELMVDLEELSRQVASPYPMPFEDVLNWRGAVPSAWSVFNAQGQLVADQTSLRWGRWDTRAWIPGVYVVDMIHTNGHCQRITLVNQ